MKKSVLFGGLEDEEDCPLTSDSAGNFPALFFILIPANLCVIIFLS